MDSFEPIRKVAEDLHHQVAGDGPPKKPMELVNAAIKRLELELIWLPTGDPALKGALVACLQGKWSGHELKVHALLSDGSTLPLELVLTKADFDGEPAVRISISARDKKDANLESQLAEAVKNDASTGFLQQRYSLWSYFS